MALTVVDWGIIIILVLLGVCATIVTVCNVMDNEILIGAIVGGLSLFMVLTTIAGFNWYHTNTASGIRSYKDFKSNLDNGIERKIIITAEDGREIFSYEGKVDVETNHEDNYIKFESEEGKRYIIYYGIQDTIQIIETDK